MHPLFLKHEGEIDGFLDQAKSESYRQVCMEIGNEGFADTFLQNCLTNN